ncbi:helix-turn-helix transcriptional regulator [Asticcacaulis endophyticus]|nr:winged helix DNA-binding protein [Asticcacaulis endophyticus]
MSQSSATLQSSLNELSTGDLDIRKAREVVHKAIEVGDEMLQRIYTALRGLAWRMIRAREVPADLPEWHDVCTHAAAMIRFKGREDIAERIETLAELIAQTSRFNDFQPLDEVLGRLHVAQILKTLARHKGKAKRSVLAKASDLGDANLSRVIAVLIAHGLVERQRSGKEAVLSLTSASRQILHRIGVQASSRPAADQPLVSELDLATIWWNVDGDVLGATDAFKELLRELGYLPAEMPTKAVWAKWISGIILGNRGDDASDGVSLQLAEHIWVKYLEKRLADGVVVACLVDISAEGAAEARLRKELGNKIEDNAIKAEEITKLRQQVIDAELEASRNHRRLLSVKNAVENLRTELLVSTASIASNVKSLQVEEGLYEWSKSFHTLDAQISAIKTAIQHFLVVPSTDSEPRIDLGGTLNSARLIEESMVTVNALAGAEFEYWNVEDAMLANCRIDNSAMAVLGNAMLFYARDNSSAHFVVRPTIHDMSLVIGLFLKTAKMKHAPRHSPDRNTHQQDINTRYTYVRDIAEASTGIVYAEPNNESSHSAFVEVSFPIVSLEGSHATHVLEQASG